MNASLHVKIFRSRMTKVFRMTRHGIWQQEHPVQRVNETNCLMRQREKDFWQTCVRLPQPSEFLSTRMVLNIADGFRGITPQWRADVTSASADEAADAEKSVFESQPVQSTAAVSQDKSRRPTNNRHVRDQRVSRRHKPRCRSRAAVRTVRV